MLKSRERLRPATQRRADRRARRAGPEDKLLAATSASLLDSRPAKPEPTTPKRGAAIKDHPFANVEDLRDITMGVVFRSRMTYADITAAGGASAGTLSKWSAKEVKKPHLDTMRRTLKACGHDMVVVDPTNKIIATVEG